ncbi:MAG: heme-degrading domain-containing protein [Paracoccaceae bacterium]
MDLETLDAQNQSLIFDHFNEDIAIDLGLHLLALARSRALPVLIDIRTPDRTLFRASLPGATPVNENWARRKSNTAFLFQVASLLVGTRNRAKGETLAKHGCNPADYAEEGGAVPIRLRGTGVVAVVTVSGLPQREDHALVIEALQSLL